MTTNVVVAVVLFATGGAHVRECTRKLIAMLKAWKIKSQFSRLDDLIFPNCEGQHLGHDNFIKRQFLPLFDLLPTVKRFNWHALRHFAVSCWIEAGLAPKTVQAFAGHASLQVTMDRYGHLFPSDDHRKAMDQIAKGLFQARAQNAWRTSMCHPCDMDAPVQGDTRKGLISLGFDNIPHRCEVRLNSAHAKAR
ncbi:MAG TPA: site-specific integrase [Steroidobacteraceae bacterium]|nr:site-specific integrase [Steroidobacteraceae bacterium]